MTFYAVLLNNESKMNCSSMRPKTSAIYFLSNAATYQRIIWFISDWWPIMLINTTVLLLLRLTVPWFFCFSLICLMRGSLNALCNYVLSLSSWKATVHDSSDHPFQLCSYFCLCCTHCQRPLLCRRSSAGFALAPSTCSLLLNLCYVFWC